PRPGGGRAIVAANGTLFGGFVGYSLLRSSGSDDPRLLFPLLAVGAGVGLGGSLIVADEWDVGAGDAWYLAAGAWWPAAAGHLLYEGRFGQAPGASADEAWSISLIAATTGLGLASAGLLAGAGGDGGAALAHSGGGAGLVLGGLAEFAARGTASQVPFAGMGYGAMGGCLLAQVAAVHFRPQPLRVLAYDVGGLLGGLAGASAASPLLFDNPTQAATRAWVGATAGGIALGLGVAWYVGRGGADGEAGDERASGARRPIAGPLYRLTLPTPAPLGLGPAAPGRAPGLGLVWSGELW
ncbi:MAG: hypothetical protein HY744_08660, partial [Deltaproteobacteria bacterium]|nr:hypothetical protein [Deltaproteobacteria bacterium]